MDRDEAMDAALHLSRVLGQRTYVRGYRGRDGRWRYGAYTSKAVARLVAAKRGSGMSAIADDWRDCAHL